MDINQIITLGIGTPSDIEHFVLFGLNANPSGAVVVDLDLCETTVRSLMPDRRVRSLMPKRRVREYCP